MQTRVLENCKVEIQTNIELKQTFSSVKKISSKPSEQVVVQKEKWETCGMQIQSLLTFNINIFDLDEECKTSNTNT